MLANVPAEFRVLGSIIDDPASVLRYKPELFTGSRAELLVAMQKAAHRYDGEITTEGVEKFLRRPVPPEVEAARGAKPAASLDILVDLATRRQVIEMIDQLNNVVARDGDIDRQRINEVLALKPVISAEDSTLQIGVSKFARDLNRKRNDQYRFIDTGLDFLNTMMGGEWQREALTVVAGSGGGGKTALVCDSMLNMAKLGIPSLFISLEMRKDKLVSRLVANMANVDGLLLRTGKVVSEDLPKIDLALEKIQTELPIYIIDNPHLTLDQMIYQIKFHKERYGIEAFFVDYLQIINSERELDWEGLGYTSQQLRNVAVDCDVAGILLSQMNRDANKKGLDSLLGSSRIGHIADTVVMLRLEEGVKDDYRNVEFDFVKNREGPTGIVNAVFEPRYLRYK